MATITAVTLLAYIPAMRGGFVWDDDILLVNNRLIHADDGLYRFWCTFEAYDYLPVTWTNLWLEWRAWGNHPAGYHVTNVLLHAAAAVLTYLLLRRLNVPGAAIAAMIFAVHPVAVASVAWISERKNTLSMVFYLLALLAYLRFDDDRAWRWYAVSIAVFALALLSKSAVVTAPVVLLGLAWWRRGKITRRDCLAALPFFVLSLAIAAVTIWFQNHRAIGETVIRPEGFLSRLATAGIAPWFYLYKALLPINLVMMYPRWNVNAASALSYVPLVLLVAAMAIFWVYRRSWGKAPLLALGYYLVMLFPVLGFFNMAFAEHSLVADHFQYFALIAPIALVVVTVKKATWRWGRPARVAVVLLAVGTIGLLANLTWQKGKIYESLQTLWQDVLERNPTCPEAWYNRGRLLADQGRNQDAILHYRRALELRPGYSEAHNNLACDMARFGYQQQAMEHFLQAVECKGDNIEARYNLAIALTRAGRPVEAAAQYRQILRVTRRLYSPDPPPAMNGLAEILATHYDPNVRNGQEALDLAGRACTATGYGNPDFLKTLSAAYAETGQFDQALQTARVAEKIATENGWEPLIPLIRRDIELYKAGRPLRLFLPPTASGPASATL